MITSIQWSSDGDTLLSASLDGSIRVWDMHRATTRKSWIAHPQGVAATGFLANGDMVSFGKDGWVIAWSNPLQSDANTVGDAETDAEPVIRWKISLGKEIISGGIGDHGKLIAATDVEGRIQCCTLANVDTPPGSDASQNAPVFRPLALPNFVATRSFVAIAPRLPVRPQPSIPADNPAVASIEVPSSNPTVPNMAAAPNVTAPNVSDSDTQETKRALESVQRALAQSYETTRQLEETAARLKQLLEIQETRLRQQELSRREERNLPKDK
jgi:hypothetical protein